MCCFCCCRCPLPVRPGECSTDDAPTLAALHSVLPRLLELPQSLTSAAQRKLWSTFLGAKQRSFYLKEFPGENITMMNCQDRLGTHTGWNQRRQFNSNNCSVLFI
eukprot:COSAG06_NODE_1790_length_8394_cov_34.639301_2_plen_105_part_00